SIANIAAVEKEISTIEASIAARKQQISSDSAKADIESQELKKNLRATEKKLERHQQKVERAEERLKFVNENIRELDVWFNGLGAIEQGLNGSTYQTKKSALSADHSTAQADVKALLLEKSEMEALITESKSQIEI